MQAVTGWLGQFNVLLLCLALLVCSAGSYIVAVLLARGPGGASRARWPWLLLLVPSFGADVWATHFIAMLAFSPGPQLFYELNRTFSPICGGHGWGRAAAGAGAVPAALARYTARAGRARPGAGHCGDAFYRHERAAVLCGAAGFDRAFRRGGALRWARGLAGA